MDNFLIYNLALPEIWEDLTRIPVDMFGNINGSTKDKQIMKKEKWY